MKNFKVLLLSFALIAGLFTSCSDNDSVTEDQNIQETQAITTSLERLAGQFNDQGEVMASANPAGNIVFDFGFDFVYPLNLSLSNGSTVAVNSLDELIQILISSTDDLFVNGIEFPFDIEVYDEETDSIIVITINNENEFLDFLDSLDWDDDDLCVCTEEYDPVCVEVTDPDGTSFIISYPNECFAFCDGFDEEDFVDNCEDDYNNSGGYFECFEFNFPLTIITDDEVTITVNSQEELDSALYNAYYFDFVYPFDVTTDEGEVETIQGVNDLLDLLEDCYDDWDDNDPDPNDDCDCEDDEFDPVCVEFETPTGEIEIFVFPNECFAECEGFDEDDFVDCENVIDPVDCTEENYLEILTGCEFYVFPLNNNGGQDEIYIYEFDEDGSLTIETEDGSYTTTGTWSFGDSNPTGEQLIVITEELGDFNDVFGLTGCVPEFLYMFSATQQYVIEVDCF